MVVVRIEFDRIDFERMILIKNKLSIDF